MEKVVHKFYSDLFDKSDYLPTHRFSSGATSGSRHDERPSSGAERGAAWGAFKNIKGVVKKTKGIQLVAHLFDTAVLLALIYALKTRTLREQHEHAISVAQRALERTMLGISQYTQVQEGIRSSELRHRTKIRSAVHYAKI
uniref:Endoplasmic reticulum transmembrane protein n=1 Tax=Haemonchus contortus TaxID=6289 RepID=A0A7I4YGT3_HAECO